MRSSYQANWLIIIMVFIALIFIAGQSKMPEETNPAKVNQFPYKTNKSNDAPAWLFFEKKTAPQKIISQELPYKNNSQKTFLEAVINPADSPLDFLEKQYFTLINPKSENNKNNIKQDKKEPAVQTVILNAYSVSPDCYREGGPGPTGGNVIANCCNCGYTGDDCDSFVIDCGDPSECCVDLGCLNLYCPGLPAIWDPESGECGC